MTGRDEAEEPAQAPGIWQPPPKDECQEEQVYPTPIGEPGDILRIRMLHDLRDNLVDFALILMTGAPGTLRMGRPRGHPPHRTARALVPPGRDRNCAGRRSHQ